MAEMMEAKLLIVGNLPVHYRVDSKTSDCMELEVIKAKSHYS